MWVLERRVLTRLTFGTQRRWDRYVRATVKGRGLLSDTHDVDSNVPFCLLRWCVFAPLARLVPFMTRDFAQQRHVIHAEVLIRERVPLARLYFMKSVDVQLTHERAEVRVAKVAR